MALLFLLALLIKFLNRSSSYDDDWFNGRAIAETVKTLSWRYMMRVPPLDGPDADDQFSAELATLVDASAGLRQAVDSLPSRPQQISEAMRTVRERELDGRRDFYVHRRLLEQARWYRRRSAEHHRRATRWFWTAIVCQVLAVVFALMAVGAVVAGQTADFEAPFVRAMSLLASFAIAVTAWTQLGHDDELSRAYAVSLQELLLIAGAAERAKTDVAFAARRARRRRGNWAREPRLGGQARRALQGTRPWNGRLMATNAAPLAARPAQPKGWLATFLIILIMVGVVGVGALAAASLSSVPDKPISIAEGVTIVVPPDWSYGGRSDDGKTILLTRGNASVAISVEEDSDEKVALAHLHDEWAGKPTVVGRRGRAGNGRTCRRETGRPVRLLGQFPRAAHDRRRRGHRRPRQQHCGRLRRLGGRGPVRPGAR